MTSSTGPAIPAAAANDRSRAVAAASCVDTGTVMSASGFIAAPRRGPRFDQRQSGAGRSPRQALSDFAGTAPAAHPDESAERVKRLAQPTRTQPQERRLALLGAKR